MWFARWKDLALRSWQEADRDNIGIIAAGVSFYCFLALVPLLGALVLTYGLLADPQTAIHDVNRLTSVMSPQVAQLIVAQLMELIRTSDGKKGLGLLSALAMALFGTRNGAGSVITALNIAYEVKETRGFFALNGLVLAMVTTALGVAIAATVVIAAFARLEALLPDIPIVVVILGKAIAYTLLALAGTLAAATLYHFGPDRAGARWTWLTPGALLAAGCWTLLTLGFDAYVAHIGHYNATYGSLSAVILLLTWLYLSSYALLFGAELNCEVARVR